MPKKPSHVLIPFLSVDRSDAASASQQIYRTLRKAIDEGLLRPGFRLPSSRDLAKQTGVGRKSTSTAYQRLMMERRVEARTGSGTYVVGPPVTIRPAGNKVTLSSWATQINGHPAEQPEKPLAANGTAHELFSWPRWLQLVGAGWRRTAPGVVHSGPRGAVELRMMLAEYAATICGISCTADEIVVCASGNWLLMTLVRLLADFGDSVLIDDASASPSRRLFDFVGLNCLEAAIDGDGLDVDQLQAAKPRLAFLRPSSEGPLGTTMTAGRRYAVMAWAKASGVPIIEDDFEATVDAPILGLRPLKSVDSLGICVYFADLGRALMPGVTMSFAIVPRAITEAYDSGRVVPDNPPVGEQLAFASFLRSGDYGRLIGRMRATYAERREMLESEIRRQLSGAIVSMARGGPLQLIVRLSDNFRDVPVAIAAASLDIDVTPLSNVLPDEQGLILGYGGTNPEQIPQAVRLLAEAFEIARTRDAVKFAIY